MKAVDILIADDEPHIIRALSFIFTRDGFNVETAQNGVEAQVKCRELTPKIIFLDLIMPKLDGLQLCRQLNSNHLTNRPYIIILTSKGLDIDRENCLKAGANEFINKPFSPREVLEKVRSLLFLGDIEGRA